MRFRSKEQTRGAAEDIRGRIEGTQNSTIEAIQAIGEIREVIQQVSEASSEIATSIGQQQATTDDITQKVARTVASAQDLTTGICESAVATSEISTGMSDVDGAIRKSQRDADGIREFGEGFSCIAGRLRDTVKKFQLPS
jgi:methyl-accepting chemotaxis protein